MTDMKQEIVTQISKTCAQKLMFFPGLCVKWQQMQNQLNNTRKLPVCTGFNINRAV